ncbi:MFS transporter [Streptomyces mirabilis]|nr:MFS transporter [Streptomyces mirabilis]
MFATTLPLLGSVYQGRQRSTALGVWGAVSGGAAAVGPVLGGLLTEGPGWRWIFFVNLPVSVASVWLTLRVVPESRGPRGCASTGRARSPSPASRGRRRTGWCGPGRTAGRQGAVTGSFGTAALALVAFVLVERRVAHPLLDLSLLRKPAFVGVMAGALAFNGVAFGVIPYLSIWMQTVLGMSPVRGGLTLLPLTGATMVVAILAGKLLHGVPARLTIGGGLLLVGSGAFCQAVLDAGTSWTVLVPGLVLVGVGTGLVSPPSRAPRSPPYRRSGRAWRAAR